VCVCVCVRERERERESRIGLEENSYICSCLLSVEGVCCKQEFQVKSPKEHLLGVVRLAFEREKELKVGSLYGREEQMGSSSLLSAGRCGVVLLQVIFVLSSLYSNRLSVFRPKVDEISLLVVNYTELNPENFSGGGFAVVYAGSKFAAVSSPKFVANSSYHITSLSMVLEFDTGRLKTPIWKSDGCQACQGVSPFLCVNGECAIRSQDCKRSGGVQDCSLSIQLTWAGTDRRYQVFNSWYQINSLGQYSLYKLYTSLKDSLTKQYNSIFH
jgi:hypothetical protein